MPLELRARSAHNDRSPTPDDDMTLLRKGIWSCLMAALLGGMVVQAILPIPRERLYIEAFLDLGHIPLFTVFTLLLLSLLLELRRIDDRPRWVAYALTLAVALFMGALTEYLQSLVARDPSSLDFERDVAGAVAAIGFAITWRQWGLRRRGVAWAGLVLALGSWTLGALGPLGVFVEYGRRDASFPVLADFEGDWVETFLNGRDVDYEVVPAPESWAGHGGRVLSVNYHAVEYPAVTLVEPVSDWSGYDRLDFDVFNPQSRDVELMLRIDDNGERHRYGDRYDGRRPLQPGPNHISIPLSEIREAPRSRTMNLHAIQHLTFFLGVVDQPTRLYFDDVQLRGAAAPQPSRSSQR
jgi:VanZ family protein